jgi:hypothetical protein
MSDLNVDGYALVTPDMQRNPSCLQTKDACARRLTRCGYPRWTVLARS